MMGTGSDSAWRLYSQSRKQALHGLLRFGPAERPRGLLSLDEVDAICPAPAQGKAASRLVPIAQIRGSESRGADFDLDFRPLQDRTRERWLGIAAARQRGKSLPPVALLQVGDLYFVRDGHHRISVARALGARRIEARVLVCRVQSPLSWETRARTGTRGPAAWRTQAVRALRAIVRGGTRLWKRWLPALR